MFAFFSWKKQVQNAYEICFYLILTNLKTPRKRVLTHELQPWYNILLCAWIKRKSKWVQSSPGSHFEIGMTSNMCWADQKSLIASTKYISVLPPLPLTKSDYSESAKKTCFHNNKFSKRKHPSLNLIVQNQHTQKKVFITINSQRESSTFFLKKNVYLCNDQFCSDQWREKMYCWSFSGNITASFFKVCVVISSAKLCPFIPVSVCWSVSRSQWNWRVWPEVCILSWCFWSS